MKKTMMTIIAFILVSTLYGQVLERQVIGSSGTSISNSDNTLNFTIGEPIVGAISSTNNEVEQGFWNASAIMTLSNEDFVNQDLSVRLFPNPVSDYLNVNFNEITTSNYAIEIYDVTGKKQIKTSMLEGENQKRINLQPLASGIYLISVTQTNTNNTNTYRIIKK